MNTMAQPSAWIVVVTTDTHTCHVTTFHNTGGPVTSATLARIAGLEWAISMGEREFTIEVRDVA